jgi:hypothetical protein
MAFNIDFSCTQTLDCSKFTVTDTSTGYVGGSYQLTCSAVPGSPPKNNIPFEFNSPFINGGVSYFKNVAITNGMTSEDVAIAIDLALSADSNISAIFEVTRVLNVITLTPLKTFVYSEIVLAIDLSTDFNGVTITELVTPTPKAPTRSVILTFADATTQTVNFPFVNGAGDTLDIAITKDYTMGIELEAIGTVNNSKNVVYLATCNTDTYYRNMGSELDDRLDQGGCSDCILGIMEKIDNYRNTAISFASINILSTSQEFLDRIPGVYDLDCVC